MSITEIKADRVITTPQDILVDEVSATELYVGTAMADSSESSAVWQIKKVIVNEGDSVTVLYADGTNGFTKTWEDRASYSYS